MGSHGGSNSRAGHGQTLVRSGPAALGGRWGSGGHLPFADGLDGPRFLSIRPQRGSTLLHREARRAAGPDGSTRKKQGESPVGKHLMALPLVSGAHEDVRRGGAPYGRGVDRTGSGCRSNASVEQDRCTPFRTVGPCVVDGHLRQGGSAPTGGDCPIYAGRRGSAAGGDRPASAAAGMADVAVDLRPTSGEHRWPTSGERSRTSSAR